MRQFLMSSAPVMQPDWRPQARWVALYGVAAMTVVAMVYGVASHDPLGYVVVGVVGLLTFGVAAVTAPRFVICLGAASSLLPLPSVAPFAIGLGGGTLYLVDVLVFVAALLCFRTDLRPTSRVCFGASGVFLLVGFVGSVIGNPSLGLLGRDVRGPLQLVFGIIIGLAAIRDSRLMTYLLRTLAIALWYGTAAIAITLATGVNLVFGQVGETQSTLIDNVRTTYDATRFQLQVNNVATLVLCAVIALLLVGQVKVRAVFMPYILPSVFLTFESFSRNSILAFAVVFLVAGVIAVRHGTVVSAVGRTLMGIVLIVAIAFVTYYALSFAAFALGGSNPLTAQVAAYKGRVIDGLTGASLQGDSSVQWRQLEWGYENASFANAPIFGHGFGAAYRPVLAFDPFGRLGGVIYAHNWYAWLLTKTGVVGAALIAIVLLGPLVRLVSGARSGVRNARLCTAVLASTVSALAVMTVSPLVESSGSALYVGAVAGVAWGLHGELTHLHPVRRDRGTGSGSGSPPDVGLDSRRMPRLSEVAQSNRSDDAYQQDAGKGQGVHAT
jgi:O-Antigen ligase